MNASDVDESWPPRSARQALLSSPSGRKKYADVREGRTPSPIKRAPGTPSLLDRLRLARNNQDRDFQPETAEDEDEETLKLELAAIETKLKLKKLQNKAKREEEQSSSRPTSVVGSCAFGDGSTMSQVQVALSPAKRPIAALEPKSPSRILLGIDKGVRGADVSLRRAKSAGGHSGASDTTRNNGTHSSARSTAIQRSRREHPAPVVEIKSFSERMAAVRDSDQKDADKRQTALQSRAKRFNLDKSELEGYKAAAKQSQNDKNPIHLDHNVTPAQDQDELPKPQIPQKPSNDIGEAQLGDASLFEGFSGLHLTTRILPHSFLKRTLPKDEYTIYQIPGLLKTVISPAYELPDEVGNFVIFGVIASKSTPFDQKNHADDKIKSSSEWDRKWDDGSNNRKKYMVMTLTDLKWTIDLFLFDNAVPRYHRLSPGTVIAVLNPSIMPPKKNRVDTGAFSLALHDGDDTVLEIGVSKDLGFCNVTKKDGKQCRQWVNSAKSEICEWHLNAEIAKTQARRMGVNAGGSGFGADSYSRGDRRFNKSKSKNGRGFDQDSGSHYFVSSSGRGTQGAPIYNPDISTARMIDMDADDPFIAEGQFSRDKEALLQKRMATQEKERGIARSLAKLGSGSNAGSTYMRQKANGHGPKRPVNGNLHQNATLTPSEGNVHKHDSKTTVEDLKSQIGKKRTAEDVRLSPVKKKTRFLTSQGIKEAGKESMGPGQNVKHTGTMSRYDSDDDDDLDII